MSRAGSGTVTREIKAFNLERRQLLIIARTAERQGISQSAVMRSILDAAIHRAAAKRSAKWVSAHHAAFEETA